MEQQHPPQRNLETLLNRCSDWERDLLSVLQLFPVPAEVFSPDGLSLFVNRAFLNFFYIDDAGKIVEKFNVFNDPYLQKLGMTDYLHRVFLGEILSFHDTRVPVELLVQRYKSGIAGLDGNDTYLDIINFPLRDDEGAVAYVVTMFVLKRVYESRADAMKAKAYIEAHWLDDFDQNSIAGAAGLSPDHLTRVFKRFIGKTPYSYYQELKLEKIKEALRDTSLSVGEAFAACGADFNGCFAELFKRRVGMTPTQYRKSLPEQPKECSQTAAGGNACAPARDFALRPSVPACETKERLFRIAGRFPIPVQIFRQNGDIVFINDAVLKAWNVQDSSKILGQYNLLKDPLVNERFGLRDQIRKAFQGEVVLIQDIRIPLESFWEWYDARSGDYDIEAIYTDILNFAVWVEDADETYIVSVFLTSRLYRGRSDVTRAREYLENHWREEFDIDELAKAVRLSPSHLARQFKKHSGMTLYSYYQQVKIERLKAALRDQNISVAQAFHSCGMEYNGSVARFFREKVGMTPSQYRKTIRE